jgi:hypothetical protein
VHSAAPMRTMVQVNHRLRDVLRRVPVTFGYLGAVLGIALLMRYVFTDETADAVRDSMSTNLHNLGDHPVAALLGSAFVDDLDGALLSVALTALGLTWLERTLGSRRAALVAFAGHVGATLVTAVVIWIALGTGTYPEEVRTATDTGISYVAFSVAAAVTPLIGPLLRVPWLVALLAHPLVAAQWYGPLPDFTSVGHFSSVLIGVAAGWLATARVRAPGRSGAETSW